MRKHNLVRLVACFVLATVPMIVPSIATAQAPAPPAAAPAPPPPQMPPSLVPLKVVDLMTPEGSAVFDAQWKSMEAKIVEGPAIANAMPGYKTSYDIQPHAGERGFDDSSWPTIGAKGAGRPAWRRQSVLHLVPCEPHDTGKGRGLRYGGRHGCAHGVRRRLRGGLGQWADAATRRLPQPSLDSRLQHTQSRGSRRCRQTRRQVPDRSLRRQRADFGRANEFRLVPRGEDRIFSLARFQIRWNPKPNYTANVPELPQQ